VLAAAAITLGALGAHGPVHDHLVARHSLELWEKAVFYHLVHAIVLWILGLTAPKVPAAAWLLLAGIAGFSGSLYLLATTHAPAVGPVTPLGGLLLLAGWGVLAARPIEKIQSRRNM
jgi:uncharacterized membrane protein YgdD (TMEM256/DUF423 family)